MTTEPHRNVVCDAGPLIHLDELACLDLLTDFSKILVPDGVWEEVARHRLAAQALGMTAHGSIGILIRSIRRRQKTKAEVLELL